MHDAQTLLPLLASDSVRAHMAQLHAPNDNTVDGSERGSASGGLNERRCLSARCVGKQGESVSLTRADLLTADEVAELLQLRPSTIQDYARRGIIPSFKLGRFRRFVRADVEATLELLRESGGYPSPR